MGTMISYAETYRQTGFEEKPFGAVDSLILSQISYYDFTGSDFEQETFTGSIGGFLTRHAQQMTTGLVTQKNDCQLVMHMGEGTRFGRLRACRYVEVTDREEGEQFSAVTFELEANRYYIAFRGTDNSVVGWKEDFCLSFCPQIPAQRSALLYAKAVMEQFPGQFYLGGHSKGGNLAVYAAAGLPKELQERIAGVFSHDGPSLCRDFMDRDAYERIQPLIRKTVPQSSVIGMIWQDDDQYQVVSNSADVFFQHDPYTWEVSDGTFVLADRVDAFSRHTKQALDSWLDELAVEKRETIVNTVFHVIERIGIQEFLELKEQWLQRTKGLISGMSELSSEDRKLVFHALVRLVRILASEVRLAVIEEGAVRSGQIRQTVKETKEAQMEWIQRLQQAVKEEGSAQIERIQHLQQTVKEEGSTQIERIPSSIGKPLCMVMFVFLLLDGFVSALALKRYTDRNRGTAVQNHFWRYFDRHYPDQRIEHRYQNLKICSAVVKEHIA